MIALSFAKLEIFFPGKRNFSLNKAKKEKENFFVERLDQFRRLEVRDKARNVFVMRLRLSDHKVLHNIASSSSFCDFARISSLFSLVFRTSKFLEFMDLIKQLFHLRLLDMRLVITNARSWNICLLVLLKIPDIKRKLGTCPSFSLADIKYFMRSSCVPGHCHVRVCTAS